MIKTVGDVALLVPVCVSPTALICDAESDLVRQRVEELYLVDEQLRLLGIVADSDFLRYRLLGGDGETRVSSLAAPAAIVLFAHDSLSTASQKLCESPVSRLPVIDGERLIGVLHRGTLLRILSEGTIRLESLGLRSAGNSLFSSPLAMGSLPDSAGLGWHRESA
jgi:CBS domain-containing protein